MSTSTNHYRIHQFANRVLLTSINGSHQALKLNRYTNTIYKHPDWSLIAETDVHKCPELALLWAYASDNEMEIFRTYIDPNIYYVKKKENSTFYNGFKVVIKPRREVPSDLLERVLKATNDKTHETIAVNVEHQPEPVIFDRTMTIEYDYERVYSILTKLAKHIGYFDISVSRHTQKEYKLTVITPNETVMALMKINVKRNN